MLTSEAEVLGLSPDASSTKAAQGLKTPGKWSTLGCDDSAVWGECQGSGSKPYQTQVDLSGPSFKCSCPSRKFPCKHGLALLLLRCSGHVASTDARPEWVAQWLDSRRDRAEKKEARAVEAAAAPPDPQAAAKRIAKRWSKADAGLHELSLWMQDLLRQGLASLSLEEPSTQASWRNMAARLVDSQLPGLAARVDALRDTLSHRNDWPGVLLSHLGQWQLMLDAAARREQLPQALLDDLTHALGWTLDKAELVASEPAVADQWLVLSVGHVEGQGKLVERRVWLLGSASQRVALLQDYAHGGRGYDRAWLAGRSYEAKLHFYPGTAALRAIAADDAALLEAARTDAAPLVAWADPATGWQSLAGRVAANPFQGRQPLALDAVQLLKDAESGWCAVQQAADGVQRLLRLTLPDEHAWSILAQTGGAPVLCFGEWLDERWQPLSIWARQGAQARMLWALPGDAQ